MKKKGRIVRYTAEEISKMKSGMDFRRLDAMCDEDIDYSDIPPLGEEFWKNAKLLWPAQKEMISLRVDKDVLQWFRKRGRGYQAQMNAVLRAFVATHKNG